MGQTAKKNTVSELKKGSAELLILALVEERPRHGYEIGKMIEERSQGTISFHIASLYPTLYRLEKRGLLRGVWDTQNAGRKRRNYCITAAGKKVLSQQRSGWRDFFVALNRIARIENA